MIADSTRREVDQVVSLAIPVVITQLGLSLMGVVDSVIVGKLLDKVALGGVALGSSLFFGVTLFALGTVMAVDPLVAQRVGAGERAKAGPIMWHGLYLAAALAVPFTALFLWSRPILDLMGQPAETAEAAAAYLRGRAWNVPSMLAFTALRGFLNGVGNTRATMVVSVIANIVNAAIVYAAVAAADGDGVRGVAGAGYGTSAAGLFMALALAWVVFRGGFADCEIGPRAPEARGVLQALRFGLPIGGTITAEVGVFTATSIVMGQLGPDSLAAHHIALQLASLTFMVPLGISVAASIRVGHAVGARDPESVRRAGNVSYVLGMSFMVTSALAFFAAPEVLARLFTDAPEVIPLAVALIRIAALFQLSDGAQAVGAGCLRGAGDSRTAFIVNLLAHWGLGFPLGYWLAIERGWGAAGLWYGLTVSLTAVAALLYARFRSSRFVLLGVARETNAATEPAGPIAARAASEG